MWPDPRIRDDITLRRRGAMGLAFNAGRHPTMMPDTSFRGWLARIVVPRVLAAALVLWIVATLISLWFYLWLLHPQVMHFSFGG